MIIPFFLKFDAPVSDPWRRDPDIRCRYKHLLLAAFAADGSIH
jgi:hypothetical protein